MTRLRIARIEVSPELIVKALHLPEGTEIFAAELVRGTHGMSVIFGLEHELLPEVPETEEAPLIAPIVRYHSESWDFDWNADVEHDLFYDDEDTSEAYDHIDGA